MGVLKKQPKTDYGSGPSEKRRVASGGEQIMRKDQGAEMSNTTESAWDHLGEAECWPAPVEGGQGSGEGCCLRCSEGTYHLRCLQFLSASAREHK